MSSALARTVSILGHPLLILPATVFVLIAAREPDPMRLLAIAAGIVAIGLGVMGWSWLQVRRRRWDHIDASAPEERRSLNRFLSALFGACAVFAWWRDVYELALGLAFSAALILVAMALTRWCKLSLHVAFATYAAGLLWTLSPVWTAIVAGFAAAVAWSRLRLSRHTSRDVIVGALTGGVAAWAYAAALAALAARGTM